jgi:hypothetical protein
MPAALVAVGGAPEQGDAVAGRDRLAVELGDDGRGPHLVLHRRLVAQQLLDRGAAAVGLRCQQRALVGVLGQGDERVADEVGDRLSQPRSICSSCGGSASSRDTVRTGIAHASASAASNPPARTAVASTSRRSSRIAASIVATPAGVNRPRTTGRSRS